MSLEERITHLTAAVSSLETTIKVLIERSNFTSAGVQINNATLPPAASTAPTGTPGTEPAAAADGEKKSRGRPAGSTNKPKAEASPQPEAPAAAQTESAAEEFDPFADASEAAPARTYTIAEITDGLKKLHTSGPAGKSATLAILTKLGVKGVAEIKEAKFAEVAGELAKHGVAV